jgi:hypothetical protein
MTPEDMTKASATVAVMRELLNAYEKSMGDERSEWAIEYAKRLQGKAYSLYNLSRDRRPTGNRA